MRLGEFTEEFILAEAQRQYTERSAAFGVDPGRTALIIVDMIDEFVKPNWCPYWVPDATRQVPRILGLRAVFHEAKLPVIYTALDVSLRGLNFPTTGRLVPAATTALEPDVDSPVLQEVRIFDELAPAADDLVILKHCHSGFYGTELDLVLRSLGVTTIVVCGTMTNFGCGATAREGFLQGYKVIMGSDVNSTDDPELHEAELRTLRRGFARIMTAHEIIADLIASTDQATRRLETTA